MAAEMSARPASLEAKDKGTLADSAFRWTAVIAAFAILVILGLIIVSSVWEARPAFSEMGLSFLTSDRWAPSQDSFGTLTMIYGTAVASLIAVVLAVPVSIGIALFISEVAPRRLRTALVFVVDLLAAVPSVVYGLWGVLFVAPSLVPIYDDISDKVEGIPILDSLFGGGGGSGRSFMTAGMILALMITPIITSVTREVIATVPQGEKDAATALGATRWEMIRGAVLPHSFGGIVGAIMLGLGRAMGETIALALTMGAAFQITTELFSSGAAMPATIALEWGESSGTHRSALIGLGVVLFIATIVINSIARGVVTRAEVRMRGAA
ncbi:MAG: phosphate ABC transporter permease subunit PstC [Acidimicrobiales bacterium]|nr:phosphate ABC transporter permease subunit PstC [Acidimicrobiales bacterium]